MDNLPIKLFIELIFILLVEVILLRGIYRKIKTDEPNHYFMLSQLGDSSSLKFFTKYLIFRLLPILLISLFNYKLIPFFFAIPVNILLINISVSLFEILVTNLKGYRKFQGTNLAYLHLITGLFVVSIPFFAKLIYPSVSMLLPQAQGVVDNIWSALIIYAILAILFHSPNTTKIQEEKFFTLERDFYFRTRKYSEFITEESEKFNADPLLIKSIVYFESKQRPFMLRLIERVIVYIFHVEISQGVMQFRTNKVIDDKQSIHLAIQKYFKDTSNIMDSPELGIEKIRQYNFSERYVLEIIHIYYTLKRGYCNG